jgi:hypothetical protein
MLDCHSADSVLNAIAKSWREHRNVGTQDEDVFRHMAIALTESGYVTDAEDGFEVLAHCRKSGLPIVDILEVFEERVRRAGYVGGTLNVADFSHASGIFYVFFDSRRFDRFAEVRAEIGLV